LNGIDTARKIRKLVPEMKILMLSMHADPLYVTEAFRAGCQGYLLKHAAASELAFAIEQLLEGGSYVSPAFAEGGARRFFAKMAGRPSDLVAAPSLTPRQREVIQLVAEGKSIKEIAASLGISVKTVEYHKARIMSELDLHTTADLTKFAIARGIASLER
jgi:DNA-binding NarL/FixJ family response regulator